MEHHRNMQASNSYSASAFDVLYLGMVPDVNLGGASSKDPDVQLIDKVEEGQVRHWSTFSFDF